MKLKIAAASFLAAFTLFGVSASAQTVSPANSPLEIVDSLPASHGVVVIDAQKAVRNALPKLTSASPVLSGTVEKVVAFGETTGSVSLAEIKTAAIGVNFTEVPGNKPKVEAVALLRGTLDTNKFIESVTARSTEPCAKEIVNNITIFHCKMPHEVTKRSKDPNIPSVKETVIKDVSFAAMNANTVAMGDAARVREAVEHKTSVDPAIKNLLSSSPTTIATFAMKSVPGLEKFLEFGQDDVGKVLSNIKYLAGSADSVSDGFAFSMLFRNADAAAAQRLNSLISGLLALSGILTDSQRADQQLYGRVASRVTVKLAEKDVKVAVAVPQADVDALMKEIKIN